MPSVVDFGYEQISHLSDAKDLSAACFGNSDCRLPILLIPTIRGPLPGQSGWVAAPPERCPDQRRHQPASQSEYPTPAQFEGIDEPFDMPLLNPGAGEFPA